MRNVLLIAAAASVAALVYEQQTGGISKLLKPVSPGQNLNNQFFTGAHDKWYEGGNMSNQDESIADKIVNAIKSVSPVDVPKFEKAVTVKQIVKNPVAVIKAVAESPVKSVVDLVQDVAQIPVKIVQEVVAPLVSGGLDAAMLETMSNEGLRLEIYKDTLGNETIGYGHMLTASDKSSGRFKNGITKAQAIEIFKDDHATAEHLVNKNLPWVNEHPKQVRDVLVDMTFNMGMGKRGGSSGLLSFKNTLASIEAGNYEAGARGILSSTYAKQVGNRAVRNAEKIRKA